MRSGEDGFAKSDVAGYSIPAITGTSKLLVFCAAETAFLRAEGKLKNWSAAINRLKSTMKKESNSPWNSTAQQCLTII